MQVLLQEELLLEQGAVAVFLAGLRAAMAHPRTVAALLRPVTILPGASLNTSSIMGTSSAAPPSGASDSSDASSSTRAAPAGRCVVACDPFSQGGGSPSKAKPRRKDYTPPPCASRHAGRRS
jgi:hypothetical protein